MIFLTPYDTLQLPMGVTRWAPPQDFAPNKIVFRLVFRPKLAQTGEHTQKSILNQATWYTTEGERKKAGKDQGVFLEKRGTLYC